MATALPAARTRRILASCVLLSASAAGSPQQSSDKGLAPLADPLGPPVSPPENPWTEAKANLGRALFWDEQLSSLDTTSCATCHRPEAAGADSRTILDMQGNRYIGWDRTPGNEDDTFSSKGTPGHSADHIYQFRKGTGMGLQQTPRNTPMVFDAAYAPELFVDGRAGGTFTDPVSGSVVSSAGAALEAQAIMPLIDTREMGFAGRRWADVVEDVRFASPLALAWSIPDDFGAWIGGRSYPDLFDEAFGSNEVTIVRLGQALAAYQRTLVTYGELPFDAYLAGDSSALTPKEIRGHSVFVARGCAECHPGALMTNHEYINIGADDVDSDSGRQFVSGQQTDYGRFRTPTLRNVALTAPYFHDGSQETLAEVVEFFDAGGAFPHHPTIDPRMVPLGMTAAEKDDLVAFLGRPLTDPRAATQAGLYEPIGLYQESVDAPLLFGNAVVGSSGGAPRMVMVEPTRLGREVTVALSGAPASAVAALVLSDRRSPVAAPYQGANLYVSMGLTSNFTTSRLIARGAGFGEGTGAIRIQLPSDPALLGTALYAQWIIYDPRPDGRLTSTQAVRMRLRE